MLQKRGWDFDGYYLVELTFRVPDRRVRDGDNLEKAILDAMQGIVYRNDCRAWVHRKTLVLDPQRPGVSVRLEQVLASVFFNTAQSP